MLNEDIVVFAALVQIIICSHWALKVHSLSAYCAHVKDSFLIYQGCSSLLCIYTWTTPSTLFKLVVRLISSLVLDDLLGDAGATHTGTDHKHWFYSNIKDFVVAALSPQFEVEQRSRLCKKKKKKHYKK